MEAKPKWMKPSQLKPVDEVEKLRLELAQEKLLTDYVRKDHNRYVNAVVKVVGLELAKKINELAMVDSCEGEA